jgi:hypothetical protein
MVDLRAYLVGQKAASKTELPQLAEGEADQTAAAEGQHSCHLVKTITALTRQTYLTSQLQQPCGQKDQILLTSQSPHETTLKFLFVHQYQDWMPKE